MLCSTNIFILTLILVYSLFSITHTSSIIIHHDHIGALNHHLISFNTTTTTTLPTIPTIPAQYFTQKLDHFDTSNLITFSQKYYVNDTYFISHHIMNHGILHYDVPVFLMLGGEGPVTSHYIDGHMNINNYAKQYGALLVVLEHRFYGDSIPNNDTSVSNLKYLNSQQALADAARFHTHINKQYNITTGKWIVFGGSYSGSLSAWLKLKYPHLFIGAISTSAPIRAKLNFPEYLEVVARSIGTTCTARIAEASKNITTLLSTPTGRSILHQVFNICSPMVSDADVTTFVDTVTGYILWAVQYNHIPANSNYSLIEQMCHFLETNSSDAVQSLANLNLVHNKQVNVSLGCLDASYNHSILSMQYTSSGRSWFYQTCTEFGYYQTTESINQPFGPQISLAFYIQRCKDVFGIEALQDSIDWTNENYGSTDIATENTLFSNGSIDPWHILGLTNPKDVTKSLNSVGVIYINGTSHCADFAAPTDKDLPGLIAARKLQMQTIGNWLGVVPSTVAVKISQERA